jgi:hypothetical protein
LANGLAQLVPGFRHPGPKPTFDHGRVGAADVLGAIEVLGAVELLEDVGEPYE